MGPRAGVRRLWLPLCAFAAFAGPVAYGPGYRVKPPAASVNWSHPLSQGLGVALFLTEGGGLSVQDAVWNRSRGTVSNFLGWATGPWGAALRFNGSSTVVKLLAQPVTDPANQDFTVAVWFTTGATVGGILVSRGGYSGTSNAGWALSPVYFLGKPNYTRNSSASLSPNTPYMVAGSGHFSTTSPYGCAFDFYTNGVLSNGTQTQSNAYASAAALTPMLGARSDAGSPNGTTFFNGSISLVLMWNRKLSAAEIRDLWVNPLELVEPAAWSRWTPRGAPPAGGFPGGIVGPIVIGE